MRVRLRSRVPVDQVARWRGEPAKASHYDLLVTGDADIYGADGQPVLIVRRGALDQAKIDQARPHLWEMRKQWTNNRGAYAGKLVIKIKKDGTRSKSSSKAPNVRSAVAGYFPRRPNRPYCRRAAFNRDHPDRWAQVVPLLQDVAELYARTLPGKHAAQMAHVKQTDPAWVIDGTPFTAITVNNTVAAHYHQDRGDLPDGFGVMFVLRDGEFDGFELVLPEHRLAVDLADGDVILFDPTAWHGNVPPFNTVGDELTDYNRISVVCYYHDMMKTCLPPADEIEQAQARGAI
jgi:hypothetical protein